MTDTVMEKANMAGKEVDGGVETKAGKKFRMPSMIVNILIIGILIMGWELYHYFTQDPWYIRMLPWT